MFKYFNLVFYFFNLRLLIYNYLHLDKTVFLTLTSIFLNSCFLHQVTVSAELRYNIKLFFSSLTLKKDFTAVHNFFNNNIFSISDNFNSLLYFLKILTTVTIREDYKDIEIELNIITSC